MHAKNRATVRLDFDWSLRLQTPEKHLTDRGLWSNDATPLIVALTIPYDESDDEDELEVLGAHWINAGVPKELVQMIVKFQKVFAQLEELWLGDHSVMWSTVFVRVSEAHQFCAEVTS